MDIELDRMCAAWMNCDIIILNYYYIEYYYMNCNIDYIILRYLAVLAIPIKYD